MTGVSQTVSNFYGGISQQPDYTKSPGQVNDIVNAIPDLTYGLFKRPGSKRIDALPNVQSGGSWFHYYRDETEGSYVGQVASNGTVRVWRCSDGDEMNIVYSTSLGGSETNLKSYLTTSDPEELHFLTINDTTFVNNSNASKTVGTTGTTQARPHTHAAFLELTKAEIRKIGFPISQQLIDREFIIAGGTLRGSLKALKGGIAFNIAGGTHHAFSSHGEAFCLLNDQAIAAQYLLEKKLAKKILMIDLDVHQGNGTAKIFEKEDRVFTFSMHGEKNYPCLLYTSPSPRDS